MHLCIWGTLGTDDRLTCISVTGISQQQATGQYTSVSGTGAASGDAFSGPAPDSLIDFQLQRYQINPLCVSTASHVRN